jgi:hypothetical protein
MVIDLRAEQKPGGPDPKCGKLSGGKLVMRDPASIDAVCLHQTAKFYGVAPYQVQAAKGDRALAKHRRGLNVHAHVTSWNDGAFTAAYPLRAYVHHGNGANRRSLGLEIEGHYDGIPGGKLGDPTDLTIATAREALRWLVEAARAEGMPIRHILAHRQYSSSRRSDPGWKIWRDVGVWSEAALGLTPLPTLTDRDGAAIPKAWDSRQVAAY